ncbi:MAG TPA: carboxypeptidase regulatory-like domain-containing protein [Myxococcaceae bacterium]|jgi:hypothetical protein
MRLLTFLLALMLLSTVAVAAEPAGSATGSVLITLLPRPAGTLKGLRVQIDDKPLTPDSSGAFRAEGLPEGWVAIKASAEGYRPQEQKVRLPAGGQTSVLLPLERIPGPGTIRGRIIRPGGATDPKVPIADVEVQVGGQVLARSDADGQFVLPAVGPGPVALKLVGAGLRPLEELVVVPSHGEASLEAVMQKTVEALAWMRGKVRSTQGSPLQATLKIAETKRRTQARSSGDFEFRLPAGRYHVTFEARGYVSQTKVVDVGAGDQALFYVDLSPVEN